MAGVSRQKALFSILMQNISLFDEVMCAALDVAMADKTRDPGKRRLGFWAVQFVTRFERAMRTWMGIGRRAPRPLPTQTPLLETLRAVLRVLQCPLAMLNPGASTAPRVSSADEALSSAQSPPAPRPGLGSGMRIMLPKAFLIDYIQKRLWALEGAASGGACAVNTDDRERRQKATRLRSPLPAPCGTLANPAGALLQAQQPRPHPALEKTPPCTGILSDTRAQALITARFPASALAHTVTLRPEDFYIEPQQAWWQRWTFCGKPPPC
ncbi:MAG: hypothetical protein IPK79_09765 [Vampirovibrionales bacterium]|nr:hypothetical protein [Vampirovibrionales bacterium]